MSKSTDYAGSITTLLEDEGEGLRESEGEGEAEGVADGAVEGAPERTVSGKGVRSPSGEGEEMGAGGVSKDEPPPRLSMTRLISGGGYHYAEEGFDLVSRGVR